jgi:FKBP-type peptidyl-prolyl cis-trans isomerase FkpA
VWRADIELQLVTTTKEKHLKKAMIAALVAVCVAGIANAEEAKKSDKAACEPPPKELVMKDIVVGTGATVEFKSPTYVGYTGWLYDPCKPDHKGDMFDTSQGRSTPFGFIVGAGRVIKGWDEGVLGMKEGGKRLLVIPPDKGYGSQNVGGGKIPPNSTLVFEVEVTNIIGNGPKTGPAPTK